MLGTLALLLSVAAYGAFYVAAPGRQSRAVGPPRVLLGVGAALTLAALVLSYVATRSAVGPALVLTVMMAAASMLAMIGPFVLPPADAAHVQASRPARSRKASSRPARSSSSKSATLPPKTP